MMDDGQSQTVGTPQGAVASPLLGNVYLHYVFDLWIQWWRKRRCSGSVVVIRYADDFVIGFERKSNKWWMAPKVMPNVSTERAFDST